jgi:hypothetical protein
MKLILALLFSFYSMSLLADTLSVKACSKTTSVCASYRNNIKFTTKQEGRFNLALKGNDEAKLVKVDLWMQMGHHGHGSSPLKVTPIAPGKFDVTKAYFVMKGNWQIRVAYKLGSVQETLIIPVSIEE